jgi:hypothetical protein
MPRGGKRPGAGAPKGNFNALKHGRRSAQFAKLGALIAANESTREAMLDFARRLDVKQESAVKGAIELHARIIGEAQKIARGEPSPLEYVLRPESDPPSPAQSRRRLSAVGGEPALSGRGSRGRETKGAGGEGSERLNVQSHDAERRSIVEQRASPASGQHGGPRWRKNRRTHNQTASTTPANNQTPNTKTAQKPVD